MCVCVCVCLCVCVCVCVFDFVSNENNTYVGLTTTILSRRLTMPLNDSGS